MGKRVQRPWLPVHKPFDTGRVTERWPGYKTTRWRKVSRLFKDEHPVCDMPECGRPTYYTEHEVPATSCSDPWDASNFRPRCKRHGDSKSGKEGAAAKSRKGVGG